MLINNTEAFLIGFIATFIGCLRLEMLITNYEYRLKRGAVIVLRLLVWIALICTIFYLYDIT